LKSPGTTTVLVAELLTERGRNKAFVGMGESTNPHEEKDHETRVMAEGDNKLVTKLLSTHPLSVGEKVSNSTTDGFER
jgi:hypothetical protein